MSRPIQPHPIGTVCHTTSRDALLSKGVTRADLWGFAHLLILIILATNCREFMANILKYGIVVRWIPTMKFARENPIFIIGMLSMWLVALLSYCLERARSLHFSPNCEAAARAREEEMVKETRSLSSTRAETDTKDSADTLSEDSEDEVRAEDNLHEQERTKDTARVTGLVHRRRERDKGNEAVSPERKLLFSKVSIISEEYLEFLHALWATGLVVAMLILPYMVVSCTSIEAVSSLGLLMLSVTWSLKIISFHHTLHDIRMIHMSGLDFDEICPSKIEREACKEYPRSLNAWHFWNFLWMPTICFQLTYPRRDRIRWGMVCKTALQLMLSVVAMKVLVEQYMGVIVQNIFATRGRPRKTFPRLVIHLVERMLKLSLPTLYTWLLMFLSFFHYWMILLAEVTRFEDAYFYEDWWNATGFGEYWRKWNLPVHNFCSRHVYKPLVSRGVPKFWAGQIVFGLSAIAHEYLVTTPLKLGFTGLVFLAFVLQTPLAFITDGRLSKSNPTLGNMIFWVVFCFTGQPMGVMIFYWLWGVKEGDFEAITANSIKDAIFVQST